MAKKKQKGKDFITKPFKVITMKISIIGSGFIGTAIGKGLIEFDNQVIFYDVVDKDLPNFTFTKDINHAIENTIRKAKGTKTYMIYKIVNII